MKKVLLISLMLISLLISSCTDAKQSKMFGYGKKFKIELLNYEGKVIRSWTSTGKVLSESSSDGYYFEDTITGKLIEVTGTLIITEM